MRQGAVRGLVGSGFKKRRGLMERTSGCNPGTSEALVVPLPTGIDT